MRRTAEALAVAILLATVLPGCGGDGDGEGPNILLITLETTRADHLGVNGYSRETSPHLDAFAAGGVNFENALSVSPRTNPSLASLMTSLYPHEHGVRNLVIPLDGGNRTLAEMLRDAGYRTMAIITHPRLVESSGFDQGFEVYEDNHREYAVAAEACDLAKGLLERAEGRGEPWFLWIHLMDPHWYYYPPDGWRDTFSPEDPRPVGLYREIAAGERKNGSVIFQNNMESDEVQAFIDLYDGEIFYTDNAVGDLLQTLEDRHLSETTIVAVTADHGESLGEHDYFCEHGDLGSEPEIHIPLMFRAPGLKPALSSIPWTVQSLDVLPTLLDLAGLPKPPGIQGTSLLPLIMGEERGDRTCFGETGKKFHPENKRRKIDGIEGKWRWVRKGRFKLFHRPEASGGAEEELFDLQSDPGEERDVKVEYPGEYSEMSRLLKEWMSKDTRHVPVRKIHPQVREQLKALGYID